MDALQLGRATLVMIITVIVAVFVIAIAFPFHQEIEAFFRQTLPAWLQANPWVQWVFSGIGVAILGGFFSLWGSSRSTSHAAVVKGSKSRKSGILAKSTDGGGAIVENSEAEQHIFAINQPSNTPPKA